MLEEAPCGKLSRRHAGIRWGDSSDSRPASICRMVICQDRPHSRSMTCNALVLVALFLSACSSSPGSAPAGPVTFSSEPMMTETSSAGRLRIEVRTAPQQPPSRGVQTIQLVIRDAATDAPESGLTLGVLPWMPAMGHGASLTPNVSEGPPGTYVVGDVDFFMPGTWELRTSISGPVTDHGAPSFQIP
jgi:YtkA-like protein